MSDVKGVEPKTEAAPAAAAPPAPAASAPKPAEPAKPAEAKAPESKPAPAKPAEAKAPEPKPAATPAPAAPAPGTVGVRAPAPKPPEPSVNISISTKAAVTVMTGLVMIVIFLGVTVIFLLNRLNDRSPLAHVRPQVPGMDGVAPPAVAGAAKPAEPEAPEKVDIGVNFKGNLGGKPSSLPGSWPAFRGPNLNHISTEQVSLANKWPKEGPPVKWTVSELATGYSGPAVHAGRVYLQDYDVKTKEEVLRCFSLDDGKEIWRRSHPVKILDNHGYTRTVPAVNDKVVICMGSKCHVLAADPATGDLKWGIDLVKDYGTAVPNWWASQCPVIDGDQVILAPCGKDVLMMGVDALTGKVLWTTPNPEKQEQSWGSIAPMTLGGKKMYVYCDVKGKVVGVSGGPDDAGKLLWDCQALNQGVLSSSPVILEDGYVFMTGSYKAGSAFFQVTESGGKFTTKILWTKTEQEGLSCEQQTPIYYKKHLFALLPDSSSALKQQLLCINPFDGGKIVWQSGKEKRFGQYEPILLADGKFYVLNKDCALTLVKASTEKYEELGYCKLLKGQDAWAPIALAGSLMLIRDSKTMICIDVGKGIE